MSKVQTLRVFVNQRLSAAAEEIFELFERTIAEYEEQLCRQNKLLDAVYKPEVRLQKAGDGDEQLLVSKEEVSAKQQEWTSSLNQKDPPELPRIKEEPEELWTNQEDADIIKFTFTPVPVKIEDDEEKPQPPQVHQTSQTAQIRYAEHLKPDADRQDCGGPEQAWNFNPDGHLQPLSHDEMSSEPETDDSCDPETRRPQSPECSTSFGHKGHLQTHNGLQTGVKPFSCSVCNKRYFRKTSLYHHMQVHAEGKRFSCSVCQKTFQWRGGLDLHMRVHTGEKPFSCSVCQKMFRSKSHVVRHMTIHTGEKPFSCSFCGKRFSQNSTLTKHLRLHTGEKPYTCSVCNASFSLRYYLTTHMKTHTEETPSSSNTIHAEENPSSSNTIHAEENPSSSNTIHAEENPSSSNNIFPEEDPASSNK